MIYNVLQFGLVIFKFNSNLATVCPRSAVTVTDWSLNQMTKIIVHVTMSTAI